nr:protein LTO1 homolog isoform X2 [Procambarus clarkii]
MSKEDIFDAVDALELQKYATGEAEGIEEGKQKHHLVGFTFGWQQACHILQELGRIEGSVLLNCESKLDPRLQNQIIKLLATIRDWPNWDASSEDKMEEKLTAIHTKSRHILHRLKIPSKVVERSVDGDF